MKKLNLIFLLVFLVKTLAFCQIGKGVYTFKPDFELITNNFPSSSQFKFAPQFGTFLTPKLLVEGQINDYISNYKFVSTKFTTLAFYANASYYYYDMKKWRPYVNLGFGMEQAKTISPTFTFKVNSPSINLGTGIQYFMNKNVAIDSKLGYSIQNSIATGVFDRKLTYSTLAFSIALKPFFDIASFEENKEATDFLHKGKIIPFVNVNLSNTNLTVKSKGIPTEYEKYSNVDFNVAADYFVTKNFTLGGGINYQAYKSDRRYGFGLSTAYFLHLKKRNYLSLNLNYATNRNNYITPSPQTNLTNYSVGANYYYFLNQNLALSAGFRYQAVLSKVVQADASVLYFNTGLKYFIN